MSGKAFAVRSRLAPFGGREPHPTSAVTDLAVPPHLWQAVFAVTTLALVFGGGTRQGLWSDAVVQLASLALLAAFAVRHVETRSPPIGSWPGLIAAATVLLPLIQLVPLPPAAWILLPGRAPFAAAYAAAEIPLPWLPLSLDPGATWRSALSLLPPVAVFLATARLSLARRRSLSLLLIGFGVASVLLGLAQLMQGPSSALRFFPVTNPDSSVGFFANRNHYAALLYCLVPFTAAWVIGLIFDGRRDRVFGLTVCALIYVALILGLGMSLSRAGIALAAIAALGSILLAIVAGRSDRSTRRALAIVFGASVLGTVLVIEFAFSDLLARIDAGVLSDFRMLIAETTVAAARTYQPFGSGLGTFEAVYRIAEVPEVLLPSYVNHAHNDWLELWLEGGWATIAVVLAFLAFAVAAGVRIWRGEGSGLTALDRALAAAATIAIALLLLHSAIDYPLRTTTVMVVFAYSAALLTPPPDSDERADAGRGHSETRPPGVHAHGTPASAHGRRQAVWKVAHRPR